jgi:hypothetical protein
MGVGVELDVAVIPPAPPHETRCTVFQEPFNMAVLVTSIYSARFVIVNVIDCTL